MDKFLHIFLLVLNLIFFSFWVLALILGVKGLNWFSYTSMGLSFMAVIMLCINLIRMKRRL